MVWGQPATSVVKSAAAVVAATPASKAAAPTTAAANTSASTTTTSTVTIKRTVKFDEPVDLFEHVEPVDAVEIEGVALLQIIKHCHENAPTAVAGSLLGMENGAKLEVTNSFPSPPHGERKRESDEYQIEMMKNLREVGMDNNKVGWYQSVVMGTFATSQLIQDQFKYQQSLGPNAVCLLYDVAETAKGSLSLKAFRLKKSFVDVYKSGVFTKESFAKDDIRSTTLIEELPIKIHNADIITCWVNELVHKHEAVAANTFERLDLATSAYLENSLKNISLWADELSQEHFKFQGYERALAKHRASYQAWQARQREENKALREAGSDKVVPEEDPDYFKSLNQPSRLEALLITKQMNTYCEHVNRYAGKSFQKLFLAAKFHKDE